MTDNWATRTTFVRTRPALYEDGLKILASTSRWPRVLNIPVYSSVDLSFLTTERSQTETRHRGQAFRCSHWSRRVQSRDLDKALTYIPAAHWTYTTLMYISSVSFRPTSRSTCRWCVIFHSAYTIHLCNFNSIEF